MHFLTSELEDAAIVSSLVCKDSEDNSAHFGAVSKMMLLLACSEVGERSTSRETLKEKLKLWFHTPSYLANCEKWVWLSDSERCWRWLLCYEHTGRFGLLSKWRMVSAKGSLNVEWDAAEYIFPRFPQRPQKLQEIDLPLLSKASAMVGAFCALFRPGINIHPEWFIHKWSLLSTGVNAPKAQFFRQCETCPVSHRMTAYWTDVLWNKKKPQQQVDCIAHFSSLSSKLCI